MYWDGTETSAWTGLAATWWDNVSLLGQPMAHSRQVPNPDLIPTSLPGGVGDDFSARFSGEVAMASIANYTFGLRLSGLGRLYVDDELVVEAWSTHPDPVVVSGATVANAFSGKHRIRVDYRAPDSTPPVLEVWWTHPTQSAGPIPASLLTPRYSNLTSTKSYDSDNVERRVDTQYTGTEAAGLPTKEVQDPGGLALTTTMTYDGFGRLATRTMPDGGTTTYTYYAKTGNPPTYEPALTNPAGSAPSSRSAGSRP